MFQDQIESSWLILAKFNNNFQSPPNTTCLNGNALECILWRKWACWRRIIMVIKFINRYSYQNYTNILLPFPSFIIDYQMDRKSFWGLNLLSYLIGFILLGFKSCHVLVLCCFAKFWDHLSSSYHIFRKCFMLALQ